MRTLLSLICLVSTVGALAGCNGGSMRRQPTLEEDLRAIEEIGQRDMRFAIANDPTMMMSQWTDDIVLLQPVGPVLRGRETIAATLGGATASVEVLDYVLDMQEVSVFGDYAVQWGTYRYDLRTRVPQGEPVRTSGKIMRVLRRQPDGSWKIHRGISTVDPQAP